MGAMGPPGGEMVLRDGEMVLRDGEMVHPGGEMVHPEGGMAISGTITGSGQDVT